MRLDIVTLGASSLDPDTNAVLVQAAQPVTDDSDAENFGEVPLIQCLGVTAMPYPTSAEGRCEGIVAGGIGGLDGCVLGARDTRTAKIAGNLKPGDTVVHSTGPQQAAQLQLKEEKRQAVLVTRGSDGKQILLSLDGKNDKVTVAAFGGVFEMTKDTISLMHPNGQSGLVIGSSGVQVVGKLLGGKPIPGTFIAMGTPAAMAAVGLAPCTTISGGV